MTKKKATTATRRRADEAKQKEAAATAASNKTQTDKTPEGPTNAERARVPVGLPASRRPGIEQAGKPVQSVARPSTTSGMAGVSGSVGVTQAARDRDATRYAQKVMATNVGYYDNTRRRVGDVFIIHAEEDFADAWMEKVDNRTAEKLTLPNAAIAREHDAILQQRVVEKNAATAGIHTGRTDVPARTATGNANPLGDDD